MFPSTIKYQQLANLTCIAQLLVYYCAFIIDGIPIVISSYVFILINLFLVFLVNYKSIYRIDIILLTLSLVLFVIFGSLTSNEYTLKFDFLILGINALLISIIFKGRSALRFLFYLNLIINLYVLFKGIQAGFDPSYGNKILRQGSRNIVNAYLIFSIIYYLTLSYINNHRINLFLILLFTFNCITLYGRSGVILSILILGYALYKTLSKAYLTILILSTISLFSVIYTYIYSSTNLQSGLDTPRLLLIQEYVSFITEKEIIFGRSVNDCCSLISSYGNNPHNSFINGHMYYGIFHTVFFIIIAFTVILSKKIDLIFFTFILYTRYSLDGLGLFSELDVVLFTIFIYSYREIRYK